MSEAISKAIDISGIDKAELLAALWNASHQQGMGFCHTSGAAGRDMDVIEAQQLIDCRAQLGTTKIQFDYLHG